MDWVTIGWFSDMLRPRLDDLSLFMYKCSMYNVVSGERTYELGDFNEYVSYARVACMKGRNEILKWVIRTLNEDYPEINVEFLWNELLEDAVASGSLDCVKTLCELDREFPRPSQLTMTILPAVSSTNRASSHGRIEILNWVFENGGSFVDEPYLYHAAESGSLGCLKFVYEKGCRNWIYDDMDIATTAAANWGHLDCLIYAHDNGCPISEDAIYHAAMHRHLDCYMYLRQNGLIVTPAVLNLALKNGWPEPRA